MRTGICLIFRWENGIGVTGTGMPKGVTGKKINKMGLGYINRKTSLKVNTVISSQVIQ